MRLILASASPRRAELLRSAGFTFDIDPADIDETPAAGEAPAAYTLRVAQAKAARVIRRHRERDTVVLAADTEVVLGRQILGKPADAADAARMLRALAGRVHEVLTAVALRGACDAAEVVTTRVWFAAMSEAEIAAYAESGEPMGKAGAYAVQGRGARFVERIDGSWSGVVGLPLATIHRLLGEVQ